MSNNNLALDTDEIAKRLAGASDKLGDLGVSCEEACLRFYVATSRLQESMHALAAVELQAANAMDNLAVALKGYAAMLYERKAQQRVQLVLLLILILLTLIVGM